MNAYIIDIETRSTADLRKIGGHMYALDPSTEIMCAVILETDDDWRPVRAFVHAPATQLLPTAEIPLIAGLPEDWSSSAAIAHNAGRFDRPVWEAQDVPRPARWIDTLPAVRQRALPPALDAIGIYLYQKGKDKSGQRLTMRLSRDPRIPLNAANLGPVIRYCLIDTLITAQVWRDEQLWRLAEQDIVQADREINERGYAIDLDLARAIVAMEETIAKDELEHVAELTHGEVTAQTLRSTQQLRAWLAAQGYELENARADTLRELLREEDLPETVAAVIRARIGQSRITVQKLRAAIDCAGPDHRIRHTLIYHGAHSGRWTAQRFQPHNLRRSKGVPEETIVALKEGVIPENPHAIFDDLLRQCIVAPPGKQLCVCDLSQIEARALAWAAGQTDLLELFASGGDPYKALAARLFNVRLEDVTPDQRHLGKIGILGCGYGVGGKGMDRILADWGVDSPIDGDTIVRTYRRTYLHVVRYWRQMHAAARRAIGGIATKPYHMRSGHLVLTLPSGREYVYRDAAIELRRPKWAPEWMEPRPTVTYHHPRYKRTGTYGAALVENQIQALCRDLLARAITRVPGIVLHVHDEIVAEVSSEAEARAIRSIMIERPPWALDLPIEAEYHLCKRYHK